MSFDLLGPGFGDDDEVCPLTSCFFILVHKESDHLLPLQIVTEDKNINLISK